MKNGTRIHIERARHGLTQEDLAGGIGVTKQTIHSIESGKTNGSVKIFLKMAYYFKRSVEYLLGL